MAVLRPTLIAQSSLVDMRLVRVVQGFLVYGPVTLELGDQKDLDDFMGFPPVPSYNTSAVWAGAI